ncbi:MAG: tRNA (adenosine(37)-N6)-dimethylallyltransferase MiaA [Clostridia bacterium]|nr:tRNA (adenosine(37)-N6)-dimethylallyltransferase MiaA [Clostridia bacterium]
MQKIPVIAVVGPTASGKSDLAVQIALEYSGEIVSCDSMQIYKGISVATAAPTKEQTDAVKHHLVEFLDCSKGYSVADYVSDAKEVIADIHARGKLPIIAGGTGLYVNSLLNNIHFTEQQTDLALRQKLSDEYDLLGPTAMLNRLKELDADYAATLHENDKKRVVRALEIITLTGQSVTQAIENSKIEPSLYNPLLIGITYSDRELLYERINKRVDIMLQNGLLQEARQAFEASMNTAAQAIGHKELFGFFKGEQTLNEALENLKMQTRRYAKRQLTWFNKNKDINWIYPDLTPDVFNEAKQIINEWSR